MAYGHSSGLPPLEAPVMIAEKRKLFFFSRKDDRPTGCVKVGSTMAAAPHGCLLRLLSMRLLQQTQL